MTTSSEAEPEDARLRTALAEERARTAYLYRELDARDRQIARMRLVDGEDSEIQRLKSEVQALRASTSWRLMAPLRVFKSRLLAWRRRIPARADVSTAAVRRRPQSEHQAAGRDILIIDVRIPTPDIQSSGVRLAAIMRLARDLGFRVTFVSDHRPEDYHWVFGRVDEELRKRVAALAEQDVEVVFGYGEAMAHLASYGKRYSAVLVCHAEPMLLYAAPIRLHAPQAMLLYDTVDLHGIRHRRAAQLSGDAEAMKRADYYDRLETANMLSADRIVAISEAEAKVITHRATGVPVVTIPNVHRARDSIPPLAGRSGLLFIGHYLHAPNVDAAQHLVRDIYPQIRSRLGEVDLVLAGSSPTAEVRSLAGNGVHVAGYVADADQYFDRARVFVAPLRFGAGMKGKIGQSMSLGLPVVTTSVGAEGMDLEDGDTVLIADDRDGFAEAVERLCRDDSLWQRLSSRAREHVSSRFSDSVARAGLEKLLGP